MLLLAVVIIEKKVVKMKLLMVMEFFINFSAVIEAINELSLRQDSCKTVVIKHLLS